MKSVHSCLALLLGSSVLLQTERHKMAKVCCFLKNAFDGYVKTIKMKYVLHAKIRVYDS